MKLEGSAVTNPDFFSPGFKVESNFLGDFIRGVRWGKDFDTDLGRFDQADQRPHLLTTLRSE
jgi:hypothetical protein